MNNMHEFMKISNFKTIESKKKKKVETLKSEFFRGTDIFMQLIWYKINQMSNKAT